MIFVCAFLGCLGQSFKRSESTASLGVSEHPNQHHGDHHQNGDRNHGRGGQSVTHNGMAITSPQPGVSNSPAAQAATVERRSAPSGPLRLASPYDGELQGGATAMAAAMAAATQPATLIKLERGGPTRRTPLHIAAERGQLHVLSAIIESLCCAATAALLVEDSSAASGNGRSGTGDGDRGGSGGGGGGDSSTVELWSTATEAAEEGASSRQQQQHRHGGSGAPRSSGHMQQRSSMDMADEFPVARPAAGGAPLAPEQYIQFHLNMQDGDGTTALSLACRYGHVDCCRLLLANGSARTLSDARGNTPLHYAALRGHLGVLFMLLDEFVEPGQDEEFNGYVDARNHAGCTPLHYAVWGRQSGSVQVLLQHGADVMPRNSLPAQELTPPVMVVGSTPLHLAAARGHVEICRIILKTFAERVLEPLQLSEDDPQPPSLASLDPRVQVNANGHMPYQVAQRLGFYPLAMLLRPSIPILRLFSDEERAVRFYGPAPLRAIAAEALNKKLLADLDTLALSTAVATPRPPPPLAQPSEAVQANIAESVRHQSTATATSAAESGVSSTEARGRGTATGDSGSNGDAGAGMSRPVSVTATLEQLAAAAAMEVEQDARGDGGSRAGDDASMGHHRHHHSLAAEESRAAPTNTSASTLGASQLSHIASAGAGGSGAVADVAAAAVGGSTGRRGVAPRQLNVEIAVAGGTLDNDGRSAVTPRRPPVLDSSQGATSPSPSPGGAHPAPPRTPPVGVPVAIQLLSPSAVSPRLMSPIALVPPSPSAGAGGGGGGVSPSASLYLSPPQLQLPSRVSSSRRSTPPALISNRSTNSMLPAAAPLVAALSRQPSAPRSNGQQSELPRAPIWVSLPGQPDVPELQALRVMPARDQASGDPAALTASAGEVSGNMSRGGDDGSASPLSAAGAAVDSGAVTMYGPRTPSRQPSAGALLPRRVPGSPPGPNATTIASLAVSQGGAAGSSAGGSSGSSTGLPSARPATSSLTTSGSLGTALALDGAVSSVRRINDGGWPPGLMRLRSNPLFEDTSEINAGTVTPPFATGAGSSGSGSGTTAAAMISMPPLAEVASEVEEGTSLAGPSGLACATVTPFASRLSNVDGSSGSTANNAQGAGQDGPTSTSGTGVLSPAPSGATATAAAAAAMGNIVLGRPTTTAATTALTAVDDEDLECGVCMEPLPMVAISPCHHQICGPCARRICCLSIQKPSLCPFCRATISGFVTPAPLTPTVT